MLKARYDMEWGWTRVLLASLAFAACSDDAATPADAATGSDADVAPADAPMDVAPTDAPPADAPLDSRDGLDGYVPDAGPEDSFVVVGSGDWDVVAEGRITVYGFNAASGMLTEVASAVAGNNLSFMAIDWPRRMVHAGDEVGGDVYSFYVDMAGTPMERAHATTVGNPVYAALDPARQHLFLAHYTDGQTEAFSLNPDGTVYQNVGEPVATGAESHSVLVTPGGEDLFVASKGTDAIVQLAFDATQGLSVVRQIATAAGAGPRHLTMHGNYVYLVNENAISINTYRYDESAHTLTELQANVVVRPPGRDGVATAADIHVHPSGDYLYASVRFLSEPGAISVCAIEEDGTLVFQRSVESGGNVPRNFAIDASGRWMLVANQTSSEVAVLSLASPGMPAFMHTVSAPDYPFFVSWLR